MYNNEPDEAAEVEPFEVSINAPSGFVVGSTSSSGMTDQSTSCAGGRLEG